LLWAIAAAPQRRRCTAAQGLVTTESRVVLHQAHLFCLQAFDELLLLQRGGSTLYAGALGENSRDLITYFEKLGSPPITPGYNPATWMLENTTASVEEKQDISFAEQFLKSELKG